MERPDRCETCRFWCRYDDVDGTCHRYPPLLMVQADSDSYCDNFARPATTPRNWCGEWQAMPSPVDAPICELDPSVRLRKVCTSAKIATIRELSGYSAEEFLQLKQSGYHIYLEAHSKLCERGLGFRK